MKFEFTALAGIIILLFSAAGRRDELKFNSEGGVFR